MRAYLFFWVTSAAVGWLATLPVLHRRGALSRVAVAVLPFASLGFLYGAKVQFRLRELPVLEALAVPPADLLTPGYHVPLGLVGQLAFGAVACRALRVPVLAMGDALAVVGAAMMPIGRLGCLLSGCCTGIVCGAWVRRICLAYPPGSAAYSAQVDAGLISAHAAVSLPVHPLQLYFGAAGLGILGVHWWLLRRGAPPGSLLAAGFVLYPVAQLALEQLRPPAANPDPRVMATVLVGTILADLTLFAIVVAYRMLAAGSEKSPSDWAT